MSYCLYSHRQTLKWNADRHVTVLYVLLCTVYTVAKVVIIYLLQALWNQILSRSSLKNLQTPPMWRKPWREFTTMIAVWLKSTLTTSRSAHWNVTIMKKLCTDKKKNVCQRELEAGLRVLKRPNKINFPYDNKYYTIVSVNQLMSYAILILGCKTRICKLIKYSLFANWTSPYFPCRTFPSQH